MGHACDADPLILYWSASILCNAPAWCCYLRAMAARHAHHGSERSYICHAVVLGSLTGPSWVVILAWMFAAVQLFGTTMVSALHLLKPSAWHLPEDTLITCAVILYCKLWQSCGCS